jgi:hypothetical protein
MKKTLSFLFLLAGCGSPAPQPNLQSLPVTAKPQHTFTLPGVSFLLTTVLTDLYLQFDQTDDLSHQGTITSRHLVCVPASAAEKAACRAQCLDIDDPNWLKRCLEKCGNLENCSTNNCDAHPTYDFVAFGSTFKAAFQQPCTDAAATCPSCTVGQQASVIEDVDTTQWVPDPIFTTVIVDPVSCRLSTFGIDLRSREGFNFGDWVSFEQANPYHVRVRAFASDPTVRCTNGINPTLRDPTFDFRMNAQVRNHHATLDVVTDFSSHVDYAFDWIYSLDDRVNGKVSDTVNGILGRNADTINKQFEKLLLGRIKAATGEDVDDLLDVHFDGDSIVVTYTPACVDGVCSCTPDCSGRECGPDPHCGVECGPCRFGTCDTASATCQCTPTATCDGHCGNISDGCGHTLYCTPCQCTPNCAGKRCGASDGCRGTCYGYCAKVGYYCTDDGDGFKYCARGD